MADIYSLVLSCKFFYFILFYQYGAHMVFHPAVTPRQIMILVPRNLLLTNPSILRPLYYSTFGIRALFATVVVLYVWGSNPGSQVCDKKSSISMTPVKLLLGVSVKQKHMDKLRPYIHLHIHTLHSTSPLLDTDRIGQISPQTQRRSFLHLP